MCGEHIKLWLVKKPRSGSSPRVRGTLAGKKTTTVTNGIIPACAGNTAALSGIKWLARDHPRVCGEHCLAPYTARRALGSSPRVRGTPFVYVAIVYPLGIIPACAGNTQSLPNAQEKARDHPRVCGEHVSITRCACAVTGSSPRVRGTQRPSLKVSASVGIIPACAGNTF